MLKQQLDRVEDKIDNLATGLRLKEQLERIETKIDDLLEEHGGKLAAEAAALAGQLGQEVDKLKSANATNKPNQ